jgi:hypothetical protein
MTSARLGFHHSANARLSRLDRHPFRQIFRAALWCALLPTSTSIAADWESTLTKTRGDFPLIRPLRATYVFGWSGITAATSDIHFAQTSPDRCEFTAAARTLGLARILWKLDANYTGLADPETLRPIDAKQIEVYRAKKIITQLAFKENSVKSERVDGAVAQTRDFTYPNLFDLQTVLLYLRSQPLKEREAYRAVVYPATRAYLVTVTAVGHEKTSVRAGSYNAIKLDMKLNRIGENFELERYRKFRRASIWISDDADRLLLRVEAQIFVGTIFTELQSVHFEKPLSWYCCGKRHEFFSCLDQ